jgi:cholest-4-en-3-one 26-monooxygenase
MLDEIDLLDLDAFARGVPHEWFTWLRHNAPVYRHPEPDGPGFWVLTKYDDVRTVSRNNKLFSSDSARGGVMDIGEEAGRQRMAMLGGGRAMIVMDPPHHTQYRKLINTAFTPRTIAAVEDSLRAVAARLIDAAVAKGSCDFVTDVAVPLPLEAICELLGISEGDRPQIVEWTNRMLGNDDPEYAVDESEFARAWLEFAQFAYQIAMQRRGQPGADVISRLLAAELDGDSLSDLDFVLFMLLLTNAGNETTRNSISHGLAALVDHPDQYAALVADPSLIPTAAEEILRWASPILWFRRNVTEDTELRGQKIAAGDRVVVWYVSANRDEDVFADPFCFDIRRQPNDHVAFGAGGAHFCLGAALARLEIRVLFEELVRRVPALTTLGDPDYLRSNFIRGIKHLPVDLTTAAPAAAR